MVGLEAIGTKYLYRDAEHSDVAQGASNGRYELSVAFADLNGRPVSREALKIGEQVIYSGDDGKFDVRVPKNRAYAFLVLPESFLVGTWQTVDAPSSIEPGRPVSVVVKAAGSQTAAEVPR